MFSERRWVEILAYVLYIDKKISAAFIGRILRNILWCTVILQLTHALAVVVHYVTFTNDISACMII